MQSHQHTAECEFIASGLDPLPDVMRAEWAGLFGTWLAQYRRGVVEPIPSPPIQVPTPHAPAFAESESADDIPDDSTQEKEAEPAPSTSKPVLLKKEQRLVLQRLKRGSAKASELAEIADCDERTIYRWCSEKEQGPLWRVGVRSAGNSAPYEWPNPDDKICGKYRDN